MNSGCQLITVRYEVISVWLWGVNTRRGLNTRWVKGWTICMCEINRKRYVTHMRLISNKQQILSTLRNTSARSQDAITARRPDGLSVRP